MGSLFKFDTTIFSEKKPTVTTKKPIPEADFAGIYVKNMKGAIKIWQYPLLKALMNSNWVKAIENKRVRQIFADEFEQ